MSAYNAAEIRIRFCYIAELIHCEKEHSQIIALSGLNFAIRTAKMDRLRTYFTDLCS